MRIKFINNKEYFLLFTISIVILFLLVVSNINYNSNISNNTMTYTRFECDYNKFNVEDRFIYVDRENNRIFIGRTEKEIKNGYYDVKINISEKEIILTMNKLVKDIQPNALVDLNYLQEILNTIENSVSYDNIILDINTNIIIEKIEEQFVNVKNNYNLEKELKIVISNFIITFDIENTMLVLVIKEG